VPRAAREVPGDEERADAAGEIDRELQHVGPDDRLEAAEPGVDHRDEAHRHDRRRDAPPGDDRERDGAREDAHRVAEEARHEEHDRREPPRLDAEAALEPGVGGLLIAAEVAREEPRRHAEAPDQVAEGELQEAQVAAGADAGDRDDGERARLGRDDRQQDRPRGEVARTEEIVGRARLPPRDPETDAEAQQEVDADDPEIEAGQGTPGSEGRDEGNREGEKKALKSDAGAPAHP
jgi:hypothetical protein